MQLPHIDASRPSPTPPPGRTTSSAPHTTTTTTAFDSLPPPPPPPASLSLSLRRHLVGAHAARPRRTPQPLSTACHNHPCTNTNMHRSPPTPPCTAASPPPSPPHRVLDGAHAALHRHHLDAAAVVCDRAAQHVQLPVNHLDGGRGVVGVQLQDVADLGGGGAPGREGARGRAAGRRRGRGDEWG